MSRYVYVKCSKVFLSGLVLLMITFLLVTSCQQAPPAPTPAPAPPAPSPMPAAIEVEISGFAFGPATITVPVGTTVTWTNKDAVPHTVTTRETLFDSGNLSKGDTFSYTFNQSGTFEYYCTIHPRMVGTVIVE